MSDAPVHIHVWNQEGNALPDKKLDDICGAVRHQVVHHFGPAWGVHATVHRVLHPSAVPTGGVLAICQRSIDVDGALAYHTVDGARPEIIVSEEFAEEVGMSFSQGFSHEVLECLADPLCVRVARASDGRVWVVEVCDPVQGGSYSIDNVEVSDFILPSWFQTGAEGPWSYLNTLSHDHQVDHAGYAQYISAGRVHQVLARGAEARLAAREARKQYTRSGRIAQKLAR